MEEKANPQGKEKAKVIPINRNKFNIAEQYLAEKYEFRVNVVALTIEYREREYLSFEILNENSLFRELQNMDICLSLSNLIALLKSDFVPQYDPFIDYFKGLTQWNGKQNIEKLASFVKTKEQKAWEKHLKKHLVRAVKCAIVPFYYNKQALIIVDPRQNSGKSTFNRFLCPPPLKDYIAEDVSTDKDSRILLAKNFIINLDELAGLSKKDISSLKSFMSKDQINERLPYDRKSTVLQRRATFVGSTNNIEFLNDESGSVRWLCFEINSIDWSYSKEIDMNEVWAEAYYLFKSGFVCDLTKDEIIESEERNKRFHVLTVEREMIVKLFDFDFEKHPDNFKTATDVMSDIRHFSGGLAINHINIGKALKSLQCPEGRDTLQRYGYFLKMKSFVESN
jgi:predicted P-loop ATPase